MIISGERIQVYVSPNGAFIRPDHYREDTYVIDSAWPVGAVAAYIPRDRLAEILFEEWRSA